jgi:UDP-N-acetylmuramyl pentapeptide phosphotransferase/UDP-N-acetylglucosamine-1-phosphate transferase/glycosyltransferase involved in cell wall biosynthesis
MLGVIALLAAAGAWAAVGLVRRHALGVGMLDMPRARGSHTVPTPRGGGLGLVGVVVGVGAPALVLLAGLPASAVLGGAVAVLAVTIVGWLDDRRSLPVAPRLLTHLGAALIVGALAVAAVGTRDWPPAAVAAWWVVWSLSAINVVNFVDGIDGIVGAQIAIHAAYAAVLAALAAPSVAPAAQVAGTVLCAACLGFLVWNWAPARVFMGDVGSGALGMCAVLTGLAVVWQTGASVPRAFLPLAPIFADAAVTLVRRALRGERVTSPHREHLYQRLANGPFSHARTSLLYAAAAFVGAVTGLAPVAGRAWALLAAGYGLALVIAGVRAERHVAAWGKRRLGGAVEATGTPRVWFVSELYRPETTSTGYFVTGIAESLAEQHDVRVLCARPTYSARGTRVPAHETVAGVAVRRCWSTAFPKDVVALRVVNLLTFTASVFWAALRRFRRGDVVVVVTNPPSLPFVVAAACAVRGARPVLLVHDVYPEVLTAAGVLRPDAALARVSARATRAMYRGMEHIVVLGRDMQALVRHKLGAPSRAPAPQLHVIPNWGDVAHVRPSPGTSLALRARLGLGRKFVVQYLGNIGRTHGVDVVAGAARAMRDDPNVHFMVVGWGGRRAWLERVRDEWDLANMTILPPCPHPELPAYLGASDLSIVAFLPGMAGVSVPSRLYNVLAAGSPVLAVADPTSELALVVAEERVGWVVPPGDTDAVVRAIRAAQANPEPLAAMGARARAAAEAKYSLAQATEAYEALLVAMGLPAAPRPRAGAGVAA